MSKGEQIIDMLYINDVLKAFEILIHICTSKFGILAQNKHFALHSQERKTLREIARIFEQSLGVKLHIKWGERAYSPRENFIPYEFGDILPDWEPKISLEEGCKKSFKK